MYVEIFYSAISPVLSALRGGAPPAVRKAAYALPPAVLPVKLWAGGHRPLTKSHGTWILMSEVKFPFRGAAPAAWP